MQTIILHPRIPFVVLIGFGEFLVTEYSPTIKEEYVEAPTIKEISVGLEINCYY